MRSMPRAGGRIAALLASLVFAEALVATGQERAPTMPRTPVASVTVVGAGTVSARPDSAEITAGVITQSATAAQALAENTASMEKLQKAVAALGIPEKDVQTTSFTVFPRRRPIRPDTPQQPEILGYEVNNQIRVKVRDLAILGRLLDQVVQQGGNVLVGIQFS